MWGQKSKRIVWLEAQLDAAQEMLAAVRADHKRIIQTLEDQINVQVRTISDLSRPQGPVLPPIVEDPEAEAALHDATADYFDADKDTAQLNPEDYEVRWFQAGDAADAGLPTDE